MKVEEYNGYKVGAAKRKFKMGKSDFAPGTLINNMNAQKVVTPKQVVEMPDKVRTAIMGAI